MSYSKKYGKESFLYIGRKGEETHLLKHIKEIDAEIKSLEKELIK